MQARTADPLKHCSEIFSPEASSAPRLLRTWSQTRGLSGLSVVLGSWGGTRWSSGPALQASAAPPARHLCRQDTAGAWWSEQAARTHANASVCSCRCAGESPGCGRFVPPRWASCIMTLERDACLWSRGAHWRGLRGAARAKGLAAVRWASEHARRARSQAHKQCARASSAWGGRQHSRAVSVGGDGRTDL